jgi:hypothetical protein
VLNLIYDKSDKGREEIKTRKYGLAPKVRPLLVLVDGKHSGQALVNKFSFMGLTEEVIEDLVQNGYVEGVAPAAGSVPVAPRPNAAPAANSPSAGSATSDDIPLAAQHQDAGDGILEPGETQYQAVYNFYTHTIKSTIGLRGFVLQLKVEKCSAIEDFRALRAPYLEAVFKAQGEEMARSLRSRLDQLLYLGDTPPPDTLPSKH